MKREVSNLFDSEQWLETAEQLKQAADVILNVLLESIQNETNFEFEKKQVGLFYSYLLILGYSVENYVKGKSIYLYKLNNQIPDNQNFDFLFKNVWKVKGHNISGIINSMGLKLTKAELTLLKKLEDSIIWASKYHLDKKGEVLKYTLDINDYNKTILRQLYKRIDLLIETKSKIQ